MCVLRGVCVSVLYNLVLHNYVVLSIQCFFFSLHQSKGMQVRCLLCPIPISKHTVATVCV